MLKVEWIPWEERIRQLQNDEGERVQLHEENLSCFFYGMGWLLETKYPEWVFEKMVEGAEEKPEMDYEKNEVMYRVFIEPFYLMYMKEKEELHNGSSKKNTHDC